MLGKPRLKPEQLANNSRKQDHENTFHRRLRLRITYNGHGFDPAAAADAGNGLGSMHRRARSLGGTLTIKSRPGETTVEANVPT